MGEREDLGLVEFSVHLADVIPYRLRILGWWKSDGHLESQVITDPRSHKLVASAPMSLQALVRREGHSSVDELVFVVCHQRSP